MIDPKELDKYIEVAKTAALFMAVLIGSSIGAWRTIKSQLKPVHDELDIKHPSTTQSIAPFSFEDSPTLKASVVRIEDRQKMMEETLKQLESRLQESQRGFAASFTNQIEHMGHQINLIQEQVNTIHRHILSNGRPK